MIARIGQAMPIDEPTRTTGGPCQTHCRRQEQTSRIVRSDFRQATDGQQIFPELNRDAMICQLGRAARDLPGALTPSIHESPCLLRI